MDSGPARCTRERGRSGRSHHRDKFNCSALIVVISTLKRRGDYSRNFWGGVPLR